MKYRKTVRTVTALVGVLSLSACLGNGGGGAGGGGAGGGSDYESAYSAIINESNPTAGKLVTIDMPTSGSASYAGQTQLVMRDSGAGSDEIGKLTGDINLSTTLSAGNNNTITGSASNFEFVASDGTAHAVNGTLNADTRLTTFAVDVTPAQTVAGFEVPELRAGVTSLYYTGTLSGLVEGQTESADVVLSGGGQAFGAGGESLAGQVALQSGSVTTGINPIYGAGTFYMNKQP